MKSFKKQSKYKTIIGKNYKIRKKSKSKKNPNQKKIKKGGSGSDKIIYDCKCKMIEGDSSQASKINISHTSKQEFQDNLLEIIKLESKIKEMGDQNRVLSEKNIKQSNEIDIIKDEFNKRDEYIEKFGNIIKKINKEFEDEKKSLIEQIKVIELKDVLLQVNSKSRNGYHQNEINKLVNSHETEKKHFMTRINKIYETVDIKMKEMLVERRNNNNTNGQLLNNNTLGNTSKISESLTKIEELILNKDCLNNNNINTNEIAADILNLKGMLQEINKIHNTKN